MRISPGWRDEADVSRPSGMPGPLIRTARNDSGAWSSACPVTTRVASRGSRSMIRASPASSTPSKDTKVMGQRRRSARRGSGSYDATVPSLRTAPTAAPAPAAAMHWRRSSSCVPRRPSSAGTGWASSSARQRGKSGKRAGPPSSPRPPVGTGRGIGGQGTTGPLAGASGVPSSRETRNPDDRVAQTDPEQLCPATAWVARLPMAASSASRSRVGVRRSSTSAQRRVGIETTTRGPGCATGSVRGRSSGVRRVTRAITRIPKAVRRRKDLRDGIAPG